MENSFQTSFIPRKPLAVERPQVVAKRPLGIFSFLATLILVGVGLVFAFLFFYKKSLIAQKVQLSTSLGSARAGFEQDTISDLELFNKRISASKQVLVGHTVLSPFFNLLGSLTIPSIQYTKFDQSVDEKGFSVKMSGVARDYKSIAIQSQVFNSSKGKYLKDVVFSNITLSDSKDTKGYVTFDISFSVDPSLISYENNVLTEATNNPKP